jgi:hypothetical protein
MGFMDKAKKLAEQAQQKLDEVQEQFNSSQPQQQGGSDVTYDEHGRPDQQEQQPESSANSTPDPFKPL